MEKDNLKLDIQFFAERFEVDYGKPTEINFDDDDEDDSDDDVVEDENDDDEDLEFDDEPSDEDDEEEDDKTDNDKSTDDDKEDKTPTDDKDKDKEVEDDKPQDSDKDKLEEEETTEDKKKQNRLENSKYAQMRKAQELANQEKERIKQEGIDEGIKQAYNNTNKFTNKPLTDKASLETFKTMLEMEKQGLDPLTDYADFVENKLRENSKIKEDEEKGKEFFIKDGETFAKTYPNVSLDELDNNPMFNIIAKGRIGKDSLVDIYKDFLEIEKNYKAKADEIARKAVAKAYSTPQQVNDSDSNEDDGYFTLDQIKKLSQKELSDKKIWAKVNKSYKKIYKK